MLETKRAKLNKCPVEDIDYIGTCPIISCPANLSRLTKNSKNGCYFLHSKSTDINSIARTTGMTLRTANSIYAAGMREFEKVLIPLCSLEVSPTACKKCGRVNCNGKYCKELSLEVSRVLGKYPLNIPELDITPEKVIRLAKLQLKKDEISILDDKFMEFFQKVVR